MKVALDLVDENREEVVDVRPDVATVADLKAVITRQTGIPIHKQILIHKNHYLVNNRFLSEYKIKMGHTVSLKKRPAIWDAFLKKNAILSFLAGLFFGLGYYISSLVIKRVLKDVASFGMIK